MQHVHWTTFLLLFLLLNASSTMSENARQFGNLSKFALAQVMRYTCRFSRSLSHELKSRSFDSSLKFALASPLSIISYLMYIILNVNNVQTYCNCIVRSLFTQGDPISDCSLLSLGALKNIQYIYNTVLSKIV